MEDQSPLMEIKYDFLMIKMVSSTPKADTSAFKYANQAWFYLSVAKVTLPDGTVDGRSCNVFDYTSKNIVTLKVYELAVKQEL